MSIKSILIHFIIYQASETLTNKFWRGFYLSLPSFYSKGANLNVFDNFSDSAFYSFMLFSISLIIFSRFSRHFVANFTKNTKNQCFLTFLHNVSQKVSENLVFFHVFRDTLFKVCKKMRKNSVFWAFCTTYHIKSVRKQCFFHVFRDILYKDRKKFETRKHVFFELFARRPSKKNEITVFFSRFSRHFVQSSH